VLDPILVGRPTAGALRILDPACGDGRFLVAAAERVERRFGMVPRGCLYGIDVDPAAVASARAALPETAEVRKGDVLLDGAELEGAFDAVVGNPPFLNQLATATSRRGRSRWGGGPYADSAGEFLAVALRAARPNGGRVGLVLPQSVLATRDTAGIRADALTGGRLDSLWWSPTSVFDADVLTCIATFVRGEPQGTVRRWRGRAFTPLADRKADDLARRPTWSHLVADIAGVPMVDLPGPPLGRGATATADFRDQYYGLVGAVTDEGDGPSLITSGLLEPGRCTWGERPARFARRSFAAPRVDVARLSPALQTWARGRLVPKVLVATQTPVIEAAVDVEGRWLPSVPVITVVPHERRDLWSVAAALTAPAASAWAAQTYLGAALSPGAIKLSARQVAAIPVPEGRWDDAAAALAAGDVDRCARLMDAAHGTDLYDWWRSRLTRRSR
jgi:hypothetical protein